MKSDREARIPRALDEYEARLVPALGALGALAARREMEDHLRCEIQARRELGDEQVEAEVAALASLGELAAVAAGEIEVAECGGSRRGLAFVIAVPALASGTYCLAEILEPREGFPLAVRMLLALPAVAVAIGALAHSARVRQLPWRACLAGGMFGAAVFNAGKSAYLWSWRPALNYSLLETVQMGTYEAAALLVPCAAAFLLGRWVRAARRVRA